MHFLENPAGLSEIDKTTVQLNGTNRFLLSELLEASIAGGFSLGEGSSFGVGLQTFGFDTYREIGLSIGYGRKLFDAIQVGARFHYLQNRIIGNDNQSTWLLDLGMITTPAPGLHIGLYFQNPTSNYWANQDEYEIGNQIHLGVSYQLGNNVTAYGSLHKKTSFEANFHFGLAYEITPTLISRIGYSTIPEMINLGTRCSAHSPNCY